MTAHEPPNPYAPTDALTHDLAADEQEPSVRRPSRLGAVVVALFAQPIAGAASTSSAKGGASSPGRPWLSV